MSLFHFPAWLRFGAKLETLRDVFGRAPRRGATERSFRRLAIDMLEERQLLSVAPVDINAVLVNQNFGGGQVTTPGKSIAVADNGDFVVTWSRDDNVYERDENGNLLTQSTLALVNPVAAADPTITVSSAAALPTVPFDILIGSEVMTVTGITTTSGASSNTSAVLTLLAPAVAAHTAGTDVHVVFTSLAPGLVDDITTSLTVVAPATPVPAAPFDIRVGSEIMQVIQVNAAGTGWTVIRGISGTVAVPHDPTDPIDRVELLSSFTRLSVDFIQGVSSMQVTSPTANPPAIPAALPPTPFLIAVDQELMWVTKVDAADPTKWTVADRGYGVTYSTSHFVKNAVVQIFWAGQQPILSGTDSNIYARYFTDESQRLVLPTSLTQDQDGDDRDSHGASGVPFNPTLSRFTMKYNVQSIQQFTVTAGIAPTYDPITIGGVPNPDNANNGLITGTFTLWFDANRDNKVDTYATVSELLLLSFDETTPVNVAMAIQNWLRALPASAGKSDPTQAIVQAVDPHHYLIDFGDGTQGLDQPKIALVDPATVLTPGVGVPPVPVYTVVSGFLPTVSVDVLQRPFTIRNIPVSTTDASQTAVAIESYFRQALASFSLVEAPFDVDAPYAAPIPNHSSPITGGNTPIRPITVYDPALSVRTVVSPVAILPDAIVSATTSLTVSSPGALPATPFKIRIDSEVMLVTAVSGAGNTQWTVSRAQDGTTAAVHGPYASIFLNDVVDSQGRSLTTFEVNFVGASSKRIVPPLVVTAATREAIDPSAPFGDPLGPVNLPTESVQSGGVMVNRVVGSSVTILKQSTQEFRANPWEPDTTFTLQSDITDQVNPAVAMTPDGTQFVITWQSQSPDWDSDVPEGTPPPGAMPEIYARRFAPAGNASAYISGVVGNKDQWLNYDGAAGNVLVYTDGQTVLSTKPGMTYPVQQTTYVDGHQDLLMAVRALPAPDAVDIQRLEFETATATGLDGRTFTLQVPGGKVTPRTITFNSTNLSATAAAIGEALANTSLTVNLGDAYVKAKTALSYVPLTVTALPGIQVTVGGVTKWRYRFDIDFDGLCAGRAYPVMFATGGAGPTQVPQAAIRPVVDRSGDLTTFRVNTNTANPQIQPAVGMDERGNFTIVWANRGQDISFFNDISMQRYTYAGAPLGGQVSVNFERTQVQGNADVAMSRDGYIAVSWTMGGALADMASPHIQGRILCKVFDPLGKLLYYPGGGDSRPGYYTEPFDVLHSSGSSDFGVVWGQDSSVAFDTGDDLLLTWHTTPVISATGCDTDPNGTQSTGVFGRKFRLFQQNNPDLMRTDDPSLRAIEPPWTQSLPQPSAVGGDATWFRLNSSAESTATVTMWPFDQSFSDAAIDADGDLMVSFEGHGPDVSSSVSSIRIPSVYFTPYFANGQNQDLRPYFNPAVGLPYAPVTWPGFSGSYDVDLAIARVLFQAQYDVVPAATDSQLSRLRSILEEVAGKLRGESDGILLSRWDADSWGDQGPDYGNPVQVGSTYTDSVINSMRDGQNQRCYIEMDNSIEYGTFELTVIMPTGTAVTTVDLGTHNPLGPGRLSTGFAVQQISDALNTCLDPGYTTDPNRISVEVRALTYAEINQRQGTRWTITTDTAAPPVYPDDAGPFFVDNYNPALHVGVAAPFGWDGVPADWTWNLFEVTFVGPMHDTPIQLVVSDSATAFDYFTATLNGVIAYAAGGGAPFIPMTGGDTQGMRGTTQYYGSIGMTPDGDMVAAYSQQNIYTDGSFPTDVINNTTYGNIYYRQFDENTDTAGPRITDWTDATGTHLHDNSIIIGTGGVRYMTLAFDEQMMAGDPTVTPDSVLNPANYKIIDADGNEIVGAVAHVEYGLNKISQLSQSVGIPTMALPSNRWEAVLTLQDPRNSGQPLGDGYYTLRVAHAIPGGQSGLRNRWGTSLYRTGFLSGGKDYTRQFSVRNAFLLPGPGTPGDQATDTPINYNLLADQKDPAVAMSELGDYVVVWTSTINAQTDIIFQRYNSLGEAVGETEPVANNFVDVNGGNYLTGSQIQPDVAMAPDGSFVVVWAGAGPNYSATSNPSDVFAQRFDREGNSRTAPICINSDFTDGTQNRPRVAMAADGSFVVTWQGRGLGIAANDSGNVYARRFNAAGQVQGPQFRVNTSTNYLTYTQDAPAIAMDAAGDFVIVWESDQQDGSKWGIYGQCYRSTGAALGQEFAVNTTTSDSQMAPRVSMDDAGNFVTTWACYVPGPVPGTSISQDWDVHARRFRLGGTPAAAQFTVNTTLTNKQVTPDVALDHNGNFTIVWTAGAQDNLEKNDTVHSDDGIYARMYLANGADYVDPNLGTLREWRVNATTIGNQVTPAVDRRNTFGTASIVWVGPDGSVTRNGTGIYARLVGVQATAGAAGAASAAASAAQPVTEPLAMAASAAPMVAATQQTQPATATAAPATAAAKPATTPVASKAAKSIAAAPVFSAKAAATVKTAAPISATVTMAPVAAAPTAKSAPVSAPAPVAAPLTSVIVPAAAKSVLSAKPAAAPIASALTTSAKLAWLITPSQAVTAGKPTTKSVALAVDRILARRA